MVIASRMLPSNALATVAASSPDKYRRVVPWRWAGGPMIPPSTKRAPEFSTIAATSRAVPVDTALAST